MNARPLASALLLCACASAPAAPLEKPPQSTQPTQQAQPTQATQPAPLAERLPKGRAPADGIFVSGQPSEQDLAVARDAGVATVVNLRPPAEQPFDEQAAVEALGMAYVAIPVDGAAGLTEANARALDAALQGAHPILLHCGSGNRVGALFGLRAALIDGQGTEAAMALARSHGMTGLEAALAERLQARAPAAAESAAP